MANAEENRIERRNTARNIALGGLGLGTASTIAASLYNKAAVKKGFIDAANNLPDLTASEIDMLRQKSGLNIPVYLKDKESLPKSLQNNAFYTPDGKSIYAQKGFAKSPIVAHEFGHAINDANGNFAKRVKKVTRGGLAQLTAPLLTSYLANKIGESSGLSERDNMLLTAGTGGVTSALANLYAQNAIVKEEFQASKNALRLLKNIGKNRKEIRTSKDILKQALNSYKRFRLIGAAGAGLGTAGMIGAYNWFKNRDK